MAKKQHVKDQLNRLSDNQFTLNPKSRLRHGEILVESIIAEAVRANLGNYHIE